METPIPPEGGSLDFASFSYASAPLPPVARKSRLPILIAGAVVALAVAGVLVELPGSKSPTASAAAVVGKALSSSLSEPSLSFTLTEAVQAPGQSLSVNATGECTISSALCGMTMNLAGSPQLAAANPITVVVANGTEYEKLGPTLDAKLPTPWISVAACTTACSTSSLSPTSSPGSPLLALTTLASEGAVVTNEGPATFGGATTNEYLVTFSKSNAQSLITNELSKLPAWLRSDSSVSSAAAGLGDITENVYIGPNGKLAAVTMNTSVTEAGQTATVALTYNITGYGVPVDVTVPPASEVTPAAQISTPAG